jgi:peptide deformylase
MSATPSITTTGHPVLRRPAAPPPPAAEMAALIAAMTAAMRAHRGVGIAAPQIGAGVAVALIDTPGEPIALISPEITAAGPLRPRREGCLSVPGFAGTVDRPAWLRVRTGTLRGEVVELELTGFFAHVASHEIDHLAGRLYIDRPEARDLEPVRP